MAFLDVPDEYKSKKSTDQRLVKEVLDQLDFIAYVENHYGLVLEEQASGEYQACCPLPNHEDSTPSFYINPTKKLFHCFGCSTGGNAIQLISKIERISFRESLLKVIAELGISYDAEEYSLTRTLREIKELAEDYVNRQAETVLPGGMSDVMFMRLLTKRLKEHEQKVNYDKEEQDWIEKVYRYADELCEAEKYKNLVALWKKVNQLMKPRYNEWRKKNESTES